MSRRRKNDAELLARLERELEQRKAELRERRKAKTQEVLIRLRAGIDLALEEARLEGRAPEDGLIRALALARRRIHRYLLEFED